MFFGSGRPRRRGHPLFKLFRVGEEGVERQKDRWWPLLVIVLVSLYGVLDFFSFGVKMSGNPGFPLDDSWIFWGYAKTFVSSSSLSINSLTPPAAGATSLGFFFLLTLMVRLGASNPFLTMLSLNAIFLVLSGCLLYLLARETGGNRVLSLLVALLFVTDGRVLAVANSGMETTLFLLILLLSLYFLKRGRIALFSASLGIGFWVRPEAVFLLLPALLLYREVRKPLKILPFLLLCAANLLSLKLLSGSFLANTGAAKFAFYGYVGRGEFLFELLKYLLFTAFPFLLVGFLGALRFLRRSLPFSGVLLLFALLFVLFYAVKLPVLYHYGRYLLPLIPLLLAFTVSLFPQVSPKLRSWLPLLLLVSLLVGLFGYKRYRTLYAYDCYIFSSRHVKASSWIYHRLGREAVVAAHDIGALGYLGERRVVDMVGLIDKEAIGLSDKPLELKRYLLARGVTHIAVLDSWFAVQSAPLLYETNPGESPSMRIYRMTPETLVVRRDLAGL